MDPLFFAIFVDVMKTPALRAGMMAQYLDLSSMNFPMTEGACCQHVGPVIGSTLATFKNAMSVQQVIIVTRTEETRTII